MTAPQTRWGILGTGAIAAVIADDLKHVDGARTVAVASRDLPRGEAFAAEHGIGRAYGRYADLLADPHIDVVYLAMPHAQHHLLASQAIAAGKNLLVEKSFTCSAAATADVIRQARAAGVFMMEAMWLRFQPAMTEVRRIVDAGEIGEIRCFQADLGFPTEAAPDHRLLDPAKGGGALLDLGVYPVSFAQWFLGPATSVRATGRIGETGVDVEAGLLLDYPGDRHAVISCSLTSASPGQAAVVGTAGRILVPPRFHHPAQVRVERLGEPVQTLDNTLVGRGYAHELAHVGQCLADSLTESPVMSWDDTQQVMDVLDAALTELGAPHVDEGFGPR